MKEHESGGVIDHHCQCIVCSRNTQDGFRCAGSVCAHVEWSPLHGKGVQKAFTLEGEEEIICNVSLSVPDGQTHKNGTFRFSVCR